MGEQKKLIQQHPAFEEKARGETLKTCPMP
jgi:hypothetical protein